MFTKPFFSVPALSKYLTVAQFHVPLKPEDPDDTQPGILETIRVAAEGEGHKVRTSDAGGGILRITVTRG